MGGPLLGDAYPGAAVLPGECLFGRGCLGGGRFGVVVFGVWYKPERHTRHIEDKQYDGDQAWMVWCGGNCVHTPYTHTYPHLYFPVNLNTHTHIHKQLHIYKQLHTHTHTHL